jgi:predicted DNA-binding transcriptional regulator AlpA
MTVSRVPSVEEIRAWPVTVDVRTAGNAWGIGRDQAYRLAREGRFPVPVLRIGRYLRVSRAAVLHALGIEDNEAQHEDRVLH